MRLTPYTKNQLAGASRSAITDAMEKLPLYDDPPRWMLRGQKYSAANISRELTDDYKNKSIDDSALAQRIAASIPSHVIDGWSYLGRAVHCFVRGDTRNSVHLAYYGELRATLAIMAAEGIGIFNKQHFIIDKNGVAQRLRKSATELTQLGTHSIVWPIYRWWTQQDISRDRVALVIKPGGFAISDWFNSADRSDLYLLKSAEKWLNDWGLDLKRMNTDLGARNASSYGPSTIHDWQILSAGEAIDRVKRLWKLFEPSSSSGFNEIDRLLLRGVLRIVFDLQTRKRMGSQPWNHEFATYVSDFLDEQTDPSIVGSERPMEGSERSIVRSERSRWQQFLCDMNAQNDLTLNLASTESNIDSVSFPVEVLSRTALLLRIATGSCGLHLNEIGIEWESLEFWLDDIGVRRGFWKLDAYPEYPTDLWTDIHEALDLLDEVQDSANGQYDSFYWNEDPLFVNSLTRLEECERIGFWGLGI